MQFGGRWVPMQVMDTIFLLWAIAALIVGLAIFWFMRAGRSDKVARDTSTGSHQGKRAKRHKRKKR